ncbi:MAG: efflux transporter outer membrane subunit [Syntrophaceae bacterium]|nr:efflux transporter outer membrane subunit [Syntrophaceae bacterium]
MSFLYKTNFLRSMSWLPVVFVILVLTGCATVGPDYVPPEISVPKDWYTQLKGGLTTGEMDPQTLAEWWKILNDLELSSLIDRATLNNLDLKKALARVREARARRGMAKADLLPTFDATGSASWTYAKTRSSNDTISSSSSKTSTSTNIRTSTSTASQGLYAASFDAGWELDIFGGVRRSVEAAEADLQVSEEDLRNVLVSLLAEVVSNYVAVRTYQARIAVAEANLETQAETYQLTQWGYEAGLNDELTLQQARYNLESTRSQIPTLCTGLEEAMNRIAVLLGEQPGKVHAEMKKQEPIPVPPLKVAVGVPADVLRRRPDVRQAERQLAAQTARIGVATADLYPKLTLSGSIGLEALSSSTLSSRGLTVTGGPQVTWAIFKAGAIRQNIEVQSALQEQYLIAYETAILSALEEVENALVAYAEEQKRRQSLSEAAQAAQKTVELAQKKFQAGLTDFSNVLEAQRSLLSFQDQLVQSEGSVTSNLVRLYKALGGGWTSLTPDVKK